MKLTVVEVNALAPQTGGSTAWPPRVNDDPVIEEEAKKRRRTARRKEWALNRQGSLICWCCSVERLTQDRVVVTIRSIDRLDHSVVTLPKSQG